MGSSSIRLRPRIRRNVLAIVVGIGLWVGASAAETARPLPEPSASSSLEDLIRYAESHSPALGDVDHRHRAALERVTRAGALPDPRIRAAVALVPIETRVGPQEGQLSLSQTIPGRGKRASRESAAEAEAATLLREREILRFHIGFGITDAYAELYVASRSLQITRDNRDLLVYLEQAIRKAYETGGATYADLIRTQVEIGRLENELGGLADLERAAAATLNSLLHRESGAPLPKPAIHAEPVVLQSEEELRGRLETASPSLKLIDAHLARDERLIELADLDDKLDWTVSLSYFPTGSAVRPGTPDSGDDPVYAGVSLSLPIGRAKYRAAEREADERRRATLARRLSAEDELSDRFARALYRFRNADRELRLYGDTLLPKAEQAFEASVSGFRTGTVGVLDLVDAQRALLQFELAYERALGERLRAVAELKMLVGGEVVAR
jgi:outer membrane protein TolC